MFSWDKCTTVTPVSYVILGLLHIARMSLYDLMKAFEAGASLFYGSSAGSIKRSLDKLLAEGAVEVTHQEPGARGRREYGLTPLGKQKFTKSKETSTPQGSPESISWDSSPQPTAHRSSRGSGNASPRNSNDWNPWNNKSPAKKYPTPTATWAASTKPPSTTACHRHATPTTGSPPSKPK